MNDEWEYEYSTTDTETFYLTVDLSHPGLTNRPKTQDERPAAHSGWSKLSRGGRNSRVRYRASAVAAEGASDEEKDDDGDEQAVQGEVEEDAADDNIDPSLREQPPQPSPPGAIGITNPAAERVDDNLQTIQILELHSENPIISYRGKVFSGSWGCNIGTEMIFTRHDDSVTSMPLPTLRHLPGGIDLLAASSVRIMTRPAMLEPNQDAADASAALSRKANPYSDNPVFARKLSQARRELNAIIPVVGDKHGLRRPQARFLENLAALKKSRGETDQVTTKAMDSRYSRGSLEEDKETRLAKRRRARILNSRAKNKWLDQATEENVGGEGARASSEGVQRRGQDSGAVDSQTGHLSIPTPKAWADLERQNYEQTEVNHEMQDG